MIFIAAHDACLRCQFRKYASPRKYTGRRIHFLNPAAYFSSDKDFCGAAAVYPHYINTFWKSDERSGAFIRDSHT